MDYIHFIWIGPKPIPKEAKENIETCRKYNSNVILHTTDQDLHSDYRKAYDLKGLWQNKASLLRYSILEKYGGWYFDVNRTIEFDLTKATCELSKVNKVTWFSHGPVVPYNNDIIFAPSANLCFWKHVRSYVAEERYPKKQYAAFSANMMHQFTFDPVIREDFRVKSRHEINEKFGIICYLAKKQQDDLNNQKNKPQRKCGKTGNIKTKKNVIKKTKEYLSARDKWVKAGKPMRTIQEIQHIYDNICKPCEHFRKDTCGLCGCRLKRNAISPFNKIAMKTESCPDGKWGENDS